MLLLHLKQLFTKTKTSLGLGRRLKYAMICAGRVEGIKCDDGKRRLWGGGFSAIIFLLLDSGVLSLQLGLRTVGVEGVLFLQAICSI